MLSRGASSNDTASWGVKKANSKLILSGIVSDINTPDNDDIYDSCNEGDNDNTSPTKAATTMTTMFAMMAVSTTAAMATAPYYHL
jgi:hypothetical protein